MDEMKSHFQNYLKKRTAKYQPSAFIEEGINLSLKRLKILNICMILISFYLFYNDITIFAKTADPIYARNLLKIHFLVFFISFIYTCVIVLQQRYMFMNNKVKMLFIHAYIVFGMLIGILISFTSSLVSFNINTYVTIILFMAIFIPYKAFYAIILTCIMHGFFLYGLHQLPVSTPFLFANQVNATVTVMVTIIMYYTIYHYRMSEFVSRVQLQEEEHNLNMIFEINPFPVFIYSLDTKKILKANKRTIEYYGVQDLDKVDIKDFFAKKEDVISIRTQILREGVLHNYIMEESNNSKKTWAMVNAELIEYKQEQCALCVITDITKIKTLENDLKQKASIDSLTGTLNRMRGMEIMEELFERLKIEEFSLSLVFFDINHLKQINDIYGHTEGDRVISTVSEIFQKVIKNDDYIFRYGGDEFILLLVNQKLEESKQLINKARMSLESYCMEMKCPYKISISYGIVFMNNEVRLTPEEAISMADSLMYEDKKYYHNFY